MSERGSMVPFVGALLFVTFAVVALVVEVALLHGAYLATAAHADAAAEYGASMLDAGAIHHGDLRLDEVRVEGAVVGVVAPEERILDLAVTDDVVCVTLGAAHRTHVRTFIGVRAVEVQARSGASPATG
mgnify:FL=1